MSLRSYKLAPGTGGRTLVFEHPAHAPTHNNHGAAVARGALSTHAVKQAKRQQRLLQLSEEVHEEPRVDFEAFLLELGEVDLSS